MPDDGMAVFFGDSFIGSERSNSDQARPTQGGAFAVRTTSGLREKLMAFSFRRQVLWPWQATWLPAQSTV